MRTFALNLALSTALLHAAAASAQSTVAAAGGNITITPIQHASVQVEHAGKVIQVDPAQGDFTKAKPADLILVTDIHGDHLNPDLIAKVRKPGAPVVMPAAVQSEAAAKIPAPIEVLANGQTKTVAGV
jgi:L-ascorbate metabolism protein UlaG (beta-lactamase superfamily)